MARVFLVTVPASGGNCSLFSSPKSNSRSAEEFSTDGTQSTQPGTQSRFDHLRLSMPELNGLEGGRLVTGLLVASGTPRKASGGIFESWTAQLSKSCMISENGGQFPKGQNSEAPSSQYAEYLVCEFRNSDSLPVLRGAQHLIGRALCPPEAGPLASTGAFLRGNTPILVRLDRRRCRSSRVNAPNLRLFGSGVKV
jgi:hypothetical protein